jgi:exonuclease III
MHESFLQMSLAAVTCFLEYEMNQNCVKSVKLCSWNIHGIVTKYHGLSTNKVHDTAVIDQLSKYDSVGLLETHADKQTNIELSGYCVFRFDRRKHPKAKTASGGIAILLKQSIRTGVKVDPISDSDLVWLSFNKLFFGLEKDLHVCFAYIPPYGSTFGRRETGNIWDKLNKQLLHFATKCDIFLCGDLNARTGNLRDFVDLDDDKYTDLPMDYVVDNPNPRASADSDTINSAGRQLIDLCITNQCYILNGRTLGDFTRRHTSHSYNGSSIVDYFIACKNVLPRIKFLKVKALSVNSDHCPISIELQTGVHFANSFRTSNSCDELYPLATRYKWSADSPSLFSNACQSPTVAKIIGDCCSLQVTTEDVDNLANSVTNCLLQAADLSLTKVKHYVHTSLGKLHKTHKQNKKQCGKKWYDASCMALYKEVKSITNAFNRNPFDQHLRAKYFSTENAYKRLTKYKKNTFRNQLIQDLNEVAANDPRKAWSIVKELQSATNPDDKSQHIQPDEWFRHFSSLHTGDVELPNNRMRDVAEQLKILEQEKSFCELDFSISEKELINAMQKLKNNKASGIDGIRNEMLKYGLPHISAPLLKLFNIVLRTGSYPKAWTVGMITPIFKDGSPLDCNNYRGITISSCLGKLFCQIINERIVSHLNEKQILAVNQIGFRKGYFTRDHIFVIKSIVDKYIKSRSKQNKVYACFIDFKKAFDSVWHEGLLLKLQLCGIRGSVYRVIKAMYTTSQSSVKCANGLTQDFRVSRGVHQGSVISPTLFNIFINDMSDLLQNDDSPILNGDLVSHLLYADDMLLLSMSESGLQSQLSKVSTYCQEWGLSINCKKTKVMVFSRSGKKPCMGSFAINDQHIEVVKEYKYLGVVLTSNGNFNAAQSQLAKKATKATFAMRGSVFNENVGSTMQMNLFDSLIKPIALYNSEIWIGYTPGGTG